MNRKRFRLPSPLDKIRRVTTPPPGNALRRKFTMHSVTGWDWFFYWLLPIDRFALRAARKLVKAYPPEPPHKFFNSDDETAAFNFNNDIPLFLELPNGKRYQIFRVGDDVRVEETDW